MNSYVNMYINKKNGGVVIFLPFEIYSGSQKIQWKYNSELFYVRYVEWNEQTSSTCNEPDLRLPALLLRHRGGSLRPHT